MKRFLLISIGCICFRGAQISSAQAVPPPTPNVAKVDGIFPRTTDPIDMVIIAERTEAGGAAGNTSPQHPIYYEAFDAGFIEAGPAIAGDKSPSAALIATALKTELSERGYTFSDRANRAALALVYSWGVIRPDPFVSISLGNKLEGNFRARLYLSAPTSTAKEMEAELLAPIAPAFLHLRSEQQNTLSLARDARYFCIVSAYDFPSAAAGQKKLLWQVRLSAVDTSGEMGEVISSLIINAGSYFGEDSSKTISLRGHLVQIPSAEVANPFSNSLEPEETARIILSEMMKRQRQEFSGEYIREKNSSTRSRTTAKDVSESSRLPNQLASRIAAYRKDKAAIQDALSAQIKSHVPGEETRRAIDAFYAANGERIAALSQEREDIRTELSRTASSGANSSVTKSLDALRKEFAADVQEMDPQSVASRP